MTVQLPHVLSELAQMAVDDVRKCEALPEKFAIWMGTWFAPNMELIGGRCALCAAGAVMANRLDAELEILAWHAEMAALISDLKAANL